MNIGVYDKLNLVFQVRVMTFLLVTLILADQPEKFSKNARGTNVLNFRLDVFLASFFLKKNRNDLNYSKFLADIFRQNTDNLVFLVHAHFKLSQQQKKR